MKIFTTLVSSNGGRITSVLVLGIMLGLGLKGIVFAATTVSVSGSCFRGGTTIQLNWTLDPTASHGYHSIWQGTNQPTYANGQPPIVGGHFATSPLSWTLPTVTASGYQSHVESHTPGHSVINSAESAPFAIDSSDPTIPVLSAGAVTTSTIGLSWSAAADSGCMGISGYKLYRGAQLITTTTGTSFTDSGLAANTSYSYSVTAYDGFASSPSSSSVAKSTSAAAVVAPPPSPTPAPTTTPSTSPASTSSPAPASVATQPKDKLPCSGSTATCKTSPAVTTPATITPAAPVTSTSPTKTVIIPNVSAVVPIIAVAAEHTSEPKPSYKVVKTVIGGIGVPLTIGGAVVLWQLRIRKRL